jgi:hypothetical protein
MQQKQALLVHLLERRKISLPIQFLEKQIEDLHNNALKKINLDQAGN